MRIFILCIVVVLAPMVFALSFHEDFPLQQDISCSIEEELLFLDDVLLGEDWFMPYGKKTCKLCLNGQIWKLNVGKRPS